jgi:glucose-1-phosphate thymidylyltransferase
VKGIVLAGGTGSRLWPSTTSVSKQLLPVYDKPMIYYPIATLMSLGLRELLVVTTPKDAQAFRGLLGDGSSWGIHIQFAVQGEPKGIAQSLLIGSRFVDGSGCALILGDNIFHGAGFVERLIPHIGEPGATALAMRVVNPQQYGIVEVDSQGSALSIEEKPTSPRSHLAVPGLYLFDGNASSLAAGLSPSARGELEITELLSAYLALDSLNVVQLPPDTVWLDAGTVDDLFSATEYVRAIEKRHGTKVGCIEEIAWQHGWIDTTQLGRLGESMLPSLYGQYLLRLASL